MGSRAGKASRALLPGMGWGQGEQSLHPLGCSRSLGASGTLGSQEPTLQQHGPGLKPYCQPGAGWTRGKGSLQGASWVSALSLGCSPPSEPLSASQQERSRGVAMRADLGEEMERVSLSPALPEAFDGGRGRQARAGRRQARVLSPQITHVSSSERGPWEVSAAARRPQSPRPGSSGVPLGASGWEGSQHRRPIPRGP